MSAAIRVVAPMLACALCLAAPAARADLPPLLERATQVAAAERRVAAAVPSLDVRERAGKASSADLDVLRALYRGRKQPWLAHGIWPSSRMRDLVSLVEGLGDEGLAPADFGAPALTDGIAQADRVVGWLVGALGETSGDLTVLEGAMAATADATVTTEVQLALSLIALERRVATRGTRVNARYLAGRVRAAFEDPGAYAKTLFPTHPGYRRLVSALPRYKALVAAGGFDEMSLEQRLRAEGWLTAPEPASEAAIEQALRELQRAATIEPTGVVDKATKRALGVPASERLRQMLLALERWHQSPTRGLETYIRVNIPAFTAEIWRDGELEAVRAAIVGTLGGQTTRLDRAITRVQVNPPWWVPPGVKIHDLDKRAAINPDFYRENGFRVFTTDAGETRVWMPAGPDNWLGRVIFRWKGGGNIYIHDTPFKERFESVRRVFSHGCVNLEGAVDLARELVVRDGAATAEEFDRKLDSLKTGWIDLRTPVPAFLEYVTVVVDEQGRVGWKPDLYGHDKEELRHIELPVGSDTAQN